MHFLSDLLGLLGQRNLHLSWMKRLTAAPTPGHYRQENDAPVLVQILHALQPLHRADKELGYGTTGCDQAAAAFLCPAPRAERPRRLFLTPLLLSPPHRSETRTFPLFADTRSAFRPSGASPRQFFFPPLCQEEHRGDPHDLKSPARS